MDNQQASTDFMYAPQAQPFLHSAAPRNALFNRGALVNIPKNCIDLREPLSTQGPDSMDDYEAVSVRVITITEAK